jgi:hypothetical protein
MHHIERGAAGKTDKQHLHRPDAEIASARLGRTIHDNRMATARLAHERPALKPLDPRFHRFTHSRSTFTQPIDLARIPAKWNHFGEKDSRQINRASPYRQSFQLWRDLL